MRPSFHILVNTSNWVTYILENLVGKVLGSAFWLFITWAIVGAPTSRQRWTFVISGTAKCRCRYASMSFILYLFEASSSHSCSFRVWLKSKPSWEREKNWSKTNSIFFYHHPRNLAENFNAVMSPCSWASDYLSNYIYIVMTSYQ